LSVDATKITAVPAPACSDRSSDSSKYVLPWKIRRVKKHKLDRVMVNASPSSSSTSSNSRHHRRHKGSSSAAAPDDDVLRRHRQTTSADSDDDDEGRQSGSSESLDSIVERILEDAALDSERRKLSKRRRQGEEMAGNGSHKRAEKQELDRLDRVYPINEQRPRATHVSSASGRYAISSNKQKRGRDGVRSAVNGHHRQRQQRTEKTLEDLFEEAVESLRDDIEDLTEKDASPVHHRRFRSAENWEKQIYDSELHDECRHYRLQAYHSRDVSRVSRGFALVQKLDKNPTPDLEKSRKNVDQSTERAGSKLMSSRSGRDEMAGDVAYVQRTVISAKASSNDARQPTSAVEDGVDLGLEVELAANQRQRTSQSSSSTWDSVSVDSLVMYDVDQTTVHAAALYSSSAVCTDERRQLNDEFVNKLRRLQDKWQQSQSNTGDDDDSEDTVWIPMSPENNEHSEKDSVSCDTITEDTQDQQSTELPVVHSTTCVSRQPETDMAVTSLDDADNAAILSDCVTTQEVVINIKLPRRAKRRSRLSASKQRAMPTVPFRELRLRREIRYNDDAAILNSTSDKVDGADNPALLTSLRDSDDVTNDQKCKLNDTDEVLATTEDSVMLTADNLLRAGDLSTLFADAEVEYDNKNSSRSVELVPVYDSAGRSTSQRVDVSRSEATRVVRLPSTSSSRLIYNTPNLMEVVDSIRCALLSGAPGARADGVAVCCEAAETVRRRGDQSTPVVHNIVVDCLQPHLCRDDDDDDDDDSANRTEVTS